MYIPSRTAAGHPASQRLRACQHAERACSRLAPLSDSPISHSEHFCPQPFRPLLLCSQHSRSLTSCSHPLALRPSILSLPALSPLAFYPPSCSQSCRSKPSLSPPSHSRPSCSLPPALSPPALGLLVLSPSTPALPLQPLCSLPSRSQLSRPPALPLHALSLSAPALPHTAFPLSTLHSQLPTLCLPAFSPSRPARCSSHSCSPPSSLPVLLAHLPPTREIGSVYPATGYYGLRKPYTKTEVGTGLMMCDVY